MLREFPASPEARLGTLLATAMIVAGLAVPASAEESAFIRTADSSQLEWGPCPPFMPVGCSLAVLHGDPAKPAADVFFKLPAGTTVPFHWHSSEERMILVSGEIEAVYEGQDPVVMKAGTYAYGPPRREHNATCVSDEDCVLFIAFVEPVDAFAAD
jgi:quercetin dioxygenase-like cupin family protein